MTKIKKAVFAGATSLLICGLGVTAVASSYNDYYFSFVNPGRTEVRISEARAKQDDLNYAMVHVTSGYLSSDTPAIFSLLDTSGNTISHRSVTCTSVPDDVEIFYEHSTDAYIGKQVKLKAGSGYGSYTISGYWNP